MLDVNAPENALLAMLIDGPENQNQLVIECFCTPLPMMEVE